MLSLEQRLQQVPWATLEHAYGSAQDTPQHLLGLLSDDEETRDHSLDQLWASICHQGSVYEASCAAVPFLIEILEHATDAVKPYVLSLLGGLAHAGWYAKRSQPSLTMKREIGTEPRHQWWSLEIFLQEGGNVYHQPEWLVKAHELVGEGIPVYLKLLHGIDEGIISATLDLLAGYHEFHAELVPELLALHSQAKDPFLQSSILQCLSSVLEVDAPEWALYQRYVVDQDASPLLRYTAAEALAWYQPQSTSAEAVAILTDIMLTCSFQTDPQGFAGTYWSDLAVGAFTHALLALCRLERSIATQALSHVLSTAASGWHILDTIRVTEALLDVAFFGGWIQDRHWTYQADSPIEPEPFSPENALQLLLQSGANSDRNKALFGWKYSIASGYALLDRPQIYVIGYDEQESSRLNQLFKQEKKLALTASQRLALETVVDCDALWQKSHDLLVIYGLPTEQEQLRQFL